MIENYKNLKRIFSFVIAFSLLLAGPLLLPLNVHATINETFNFQAKLTNVNGTNVTDGTYNFRFSIYDASAAGNCLWTSKGTIPGSGSCTFAGGSPGTDLVAVTVTNGLFNVNLGTSAGGLTTFEDVTANLAKFSNNSLYLDIQVYNGSSWETFGSRKLLESVPYAFRAKYADTSINVPLSGITAATTTNTIDNLLNAQTWNWSTLSTQTALSYSANSLTTGSVLGISSSTTAASASGDLVKFELTGNSANVTGNALKVGITGGSLTTATALNVTSAGTGITFRVNDDGTYTDSSPFVIDTDGNVGIGTTTPGAKLNVVGGNILLDNGSKVYMASTTNNAGYFFDASSAWGLRAYNSGANYYTDILFDSTGGGGGNSRGIRLMDTNGSAVRLFVGDSGNVGIGDTTPASLLSVGSGDLFQVDSSGNIVKINNVTTSFPASQGGSNTYLKNDGSGGLTWASVSASAAISGLTLATGTNTIDNTLYAQQWDWSTLSTQNALTLTSNGITTGNLLSLTSTSTALTSSSLLNILATGDPAASWTGALAKVEYTTSTDVDINGDALRVGITGAGTGQGITLNITSAQTGTNALAFRVNDDGTYTDSTPFAIDKTGNTSIGSTTFTSLFNVGSSAQFQVNSSGQIAAAAGIISSGTIQFSTLTSNGPLYTSGGNGTLTTTAPTSGAIGYWSRSGTTISPTTANDVLSISGNTSDIIYATSSSSTADNKVLNVWQSGATSGTDYAGYFYNSGGSTTNVAIYAASAFSGGSDYAIITNGGNVGIGDTSPVSLLTVGSSDTFQVDTSGNIIKINNVTTSFPASQGGSNTYLKNNGSGVLTWDTVSASASLGSLTAASQVNTIDNTLYAQTWDWSTLSTQNALTLTGNGITTGNLLSLTSTSTALTSSSLLNILATGDPAASWTGALAKIEYTTSIDTDINGDGLRVGITGAGAGQGTTLNITSAQTGTNAFVFKVNDDGTYSDTTAFSVDKAGVVRAGGQYLAPDGAIATPSFGFLNNTNMGFYRYGNNVMGTSVNGQGGFFLDGTSGTGRVSIDYPVAAASKFQISNDANTAAGGITLGTNASTYIQIYKSASNKLTIGGGNVGIGDTTPASLFTVGASGEFQVNSTGNIVKINNVITSFPGSQGGASSLLLNDGSGNLSWAATSGTGAIGYLSRTGTTLSQTNANDILSFTGNAGDILTVTSSATGASNKGINVSQTGATVGTDYAGYFSNTGAGTTSVGIYASASGATNNYGIIVPNGFIGVGTSTPQNPFDIVRGTAGSMNKGTYESASFEYDGDNKVGIYTNSAFGNGAALIFGNTGNTDINGYYPGFETQYVSASAVASNYIRYNFVERNAAGSVLASATDILVITGDSKVGVGDATPASAFTVGSGDKFQVDSTGNIIKINNVTTSFPASQGGSNTYLKNNGSGVLTWDTVSASASISTLTLAGGTNTIDNTLYAQQWDWSTLSTQTALRLTGNGLTTGNVFNISSSTTAASASGDLVKFEMSGNSANVTGNVLKVGLTGGTSTTATAFNLTSAATGITFRVNDDGTYTDSSPFIIDTSGNVGIGVTSVGSERLNIDNKLRLITSGTPEAGYMFGTSMPSGSVTEGSGIILSYGINVPQVGTRDNNTIGGIFRLDTRGGAYEPVSFEVIGYPTGGATGYDRLAINLQTGDTLLASSGGNVAIGGTTLTSLFNVGASAQFQVNTSGQIAAAAGIISSGTIQFSSLTSNGPLYTSGGNGTLTTTAPTSGAIGYWSRTSTTLSPTTANDILSIANTTTTGADFGITNTGVYTGTGIFNLTANSATTGAIANISGTGLTTGDALRITGGTAMTTGSDIEINGATYVHGANSEVGSLASMAFSDTTSGAYTSTTNGILMQPTINITAGAANKTINGISVNPTFTACTTATCTVTGLNVANVTDSGNFNSTGLKIGTGWDEAINASGNVTIGTKTDATAHNFASGCNCLTNSAIGTFGSGGADTNRDAVSSAVVYKGKLFISTKEADLAGIYRYDGGTNPWTLVTNAVGKAISTDTANIDAFVLAVFNGALYAGSQTGAATNTGALYQSTTAETGTDVFSATLVNTARGSFGMSQTAIDGVSDLAVFEGNLYVGTQEPNAMEIGRYDGGTTFVQTNTPDGEFISTDATDIDGVVFKVYGNRLFVGATTGALTARISVYDGIGTTMTATQATLGTFDAVTQNIDVTSMKVWNGELYIAASKANSAGVYRWLPDPSMTISTVVTNYNLVSNAAGKLNSGDTANIDSVILQNYNGRLYAGSYNATDGTGALYEYDGTKGNWTLINTTRGDFNNNTATNGISLLIEFNGTLYVGVDDGTANKGAVYTWSKTSSNSFNLQFDSGNNNYGAISFIGNKQALTGDDKYGTFNFSNPIALSSGAFDYAEDYPTNDSSLTSGDIVTVDPNKPEYVIRAKAGNSVIGIVSKKPGFRLSTSETLEEGSKWIPIALVGRVPVKVTSINGVIKSGDKISVSNITGVGMKSSGGEETIGVALADYNQLDPNIIGEVSMFVNISYENKNITKEEYEQYNINVTENPLDNTNIYSLSNSDLSKSINELGLFDQVKSSSITSGLINTADLTINGINFTNYLTDLNTKLSLLQSDSKSITDSETTENKTTLIKDVSNEVKTETQSEFELLKKQLTTLIEDKFSSLSSTNTINSDVLGTSSTSINLPKLNTLSSKINILEDGSIEILGSVKFSELLNVESLKTKKISAYSGSDLIAELSDDNGKSKFSILSLTGKELFSVDSTGKTNINNDLTVKGDLNISGKIAGESVFESKWIEIPANSEISIKHDLGVIPRSINVLRASDSDCDSKSGELDCTNVTNEGFGNKDVYYYKNLDKNFIKVVNALSDKIFVKVFVTK